MEAWLQNSWLASFLPQTCTIPKILCEDRTVSAELFDFSVCYLWTPVYWG